MNEDYQQKAESLVLEARGWLVLDQQAYDLAADMLTGLKAVEQKIVEHHDPMRKRTYDAWQAVLAAQKKLLDPVLEAQRILKTRIGVWEIEQKALEEKRRQAAEAEARRVAEETREREIEQAEAEGADVEEVTAMIAAPLPTVVPHVEPVYQPARGISTAMNWRAEVTSLAALVKAIAAGHANLTLVMPNEVALNQLARATKGTLVVPGVRFYEVPVVRAGRRTR